MIKTILISALLLLCLGTISSSQKTVCEDCVKDEAKAKQIAEDLWLKAFGKSIYNKKPFIVEKRVSIWVVKGTLHAKKGGVPYVEIRSKDCKILKLTHTK